MTFLRGSAEYYMAIKLEAQQTLSILQSLTPGTMHTESTQAELAGKCLMSSSVVTYNMHA